MFPTRLTIALIVVDVAIGFSFQQPRFDLGGPCSPTMNAEDPRIYREMAEARKSQSWDRLIELEKRFVRDGCAVDYRRRELADVFVRAGRQTEAVQVLEEMDSRGFDLSFSVNPKQFGDEQKELRQFMGTPEFRATSVGMKIEGLKKISDARRASYREILKRMPSSQRPPKNYIARPACPFECCRFGDWTALEDIELVAAPGSPRVVGRAVKGGHVDALTGEVHLRPEPILALMKVDGGPPKDRIAFALDYEGEGYRHVYTQGKVVSIFTSIAGYCFRPSEACWAETLDLPEERKEPVWWVKIRLPNGVIGWTDKTKRFDGEDGCS